LSGLAEHVLVMPDVIDAPSRFDDTATGDDRLGEINATTIGTTRERRMQQALARPALLDTQHSF